MTDKMLLAHYMAWFGKEDAPTWHWKGLGKATPFDGSEDPQTGRFRIASHDYPLRGPYCSRDANVIDNQLDEMKQHGIGGVIVDWYGPGAISAKGPPYHDYADIHLATAIVLDRVERAGMKFILCFDSHSLDEVEKLHEGNTTAYPETPAHYAERSLSTACTQIFDSPAYLRHAGRPLLLQFGFPEASVGWPALLTALPTGCTAKPCIVVQGVIGGRPWAEGSFAWPEVRLTGECDVVKPWGAVEDNLAAFYGSTQDK